MSVYGMRHGANLPAGFQYPPSLSQDRWEDRTVVLPAYVIREELKRQEAERATFLGFWQYPSAETARPCKSQVRRWAAIACGFKLEARKSYARAWLLFCTVGGKSAPEPRDHGLLESDAEKIRQRFADADCFDPRDFAGVPF